MSTSVVVTKAVLLKLLEFLAYIAVDSTPGRMTLARELLRDLAVPVAEALADTGGALGEVIDEVDFALACGCPVDHRHSSRGLCIEGPCRVCHGDPRYERTRGMTADIPPRRR